MAQIRAVEWSLEASVNLDKIIAYLEREWSEKEVGHFFERLEKQLSIILRTPEIYKKSLRKEGFTNVKLPIIILFFTRMMIAKYISSQFLIIDKIRISYFQNDDL